MPKSKNKLGCFILLGSLLGGTVVYHTTDKLMHADNLSSYTLSIVKDDAVTVSELPASVVEGSRVDFSLSFDADAYLVKEVLVNSELPVAKGNSYSFKMPAADTSIVIKGVSLLDLSNPITNLDSDKGVVLTGLPTKAEPGSLLSFKVEFGWNSGYSFNNHVSVFHTEVAEDNKLDVSYNAVNKEFSFEMPDAPVFIDVAEVAKRFTLNRDTSSNANISKVEFSSDGETFTSNSSSSGFNVTFGSKIRVTAKESDALVPTAIKVVSNFGENSIDLDADLKAVFDMPASNATLFVTGNINYKSVTLSPSENISITLVEPSDDGSYVPLADNDHIVPGTTVYVKAVSTSETYALSKLTVTKGGSSSVSVTTVDEDNGIYSFKMPNANDVVISSTETEIKFANAAFLGTFYGFNLMSSSTNKACSTSYGVKINNLGEVYKGTSSSPTSTISTVTPSSEGSNDSLLTLASGKDIIVTPNFVLGHYSFNNVFASNFGNDFLLATKSVNSSHTYEDYRFDCLLNKGNFLAVSSFYLDENDNKVYCASLFVDFANKLFYGDGLSFVLADGTSDFATTSSTFDVSVNGVTVGTVSNNAYTKAA